jgi:hypothetical protein
LQNTLLAIGIALIAAIVAALVGPWLIDWKAYKPQLEAEASQVFGTPVRIGGELSIRLLPTISIDARDVTIGTPTNGARIGRLRGELRVAPLLRGEVSLASVHIRDADINLSLAATPGQVLPAEEVIIENARLSIADASGETMLIAERMMLGGESRGRKGPVRLEGSATVGEHVLPVYLLTGFNEAGALTLRLRASERASGFGVEAEGTVGAAGRPRFDGEVVLTGSTGAFPWRVAGPAAVTPKAMVFERAEAQIGAGEQAVRATGSLRYGFGAEPSLGVVVTARQMDLDRLVPNPSGAARTPRDVITALVAGAPILGGTDMSVSLGFDIDGVTLGGAPLTDVKGDLVSDARGWAAERFSARLPGDSLAEATGRILLSPEPGFTGQLSLQSSRPAVLMSWLDGQPTPAGTLDDPIRLATAMIAEPGRLILDSLEATTSAGSAAGRIALDMPALGRHALQLDLTADAIDLDLLMRLARGAGARLDPATDTRLKLKAAQATLGGLAARGLDLTMATDGRTFDAERLRIVDLAGFGMDLTGRLDGLGGPLIGRLGGRLTAANVDGLIALLSRNERTAAIAAWLRERAPSLAGADLGLTFAARGRAALGLRIEGRLGNAAVEIDAAGAGELSRLDLLTGRIDLKLEAPRADQVYALVAGRRPASATPATPTRLDVRIERPVAETWTAKGGVTAAGSRLSFEAGRQSNGSGTLAANLQSTDVAPILPLFGVPAELAGRLPSTLTLQGTAQGADWRTEKLAGRIGATEIDAALSGRGMAVKGRARLGTMTADALMAVLSGPAWLIETEAGQFAGASFGSSPFDGLDAELDLSIDRIGLGSYPALTAVRAQLVREGDRTRIGNLAARLGEARLAGELRLDRSLLSTALGGTLSLDAVPLALAWPGAQGAGGLSLDIAADGASPAALIAGLTGNGTFRWPAASVAGGNPQALAKVTRLAEIAQDIGRPMNDMAFGAALSQALESPMAVPAATTPVTLSGTLLRAGETAFAVTGGRVTWAGSIDLAEGQLGASVRVMPDPIAEAETMPLIAIRHEGPLGQPARRLDTDDVSGWLGLRLVDRAALRIQMTESDRLERSRQRAFSRFTLRPPPQPELPLPSMPGLLAPDLFLSPAPTEPGPGAETTPEAAPVPLRRPAEPRLLPRAAPPQAGSDLPSVVRRALDGSRTAPPAAPGTPLSILPQLPPPVEVGPAPGQRR